MKPSNNYSLIIWDIANTLQYPNPTYASHPLKKWGLDPGLIDWIKSRQDLKHAIISNYTQDFVDRLLEASELKRYFSYASGVNAAKNKKPQLDQYTVMPEKLRNIPKTSQLMIGDLPSDMEFAERLGIHGIIVHNTLPPTHPSTQASLKNTQDIITWLNKQLPLKNG